MQIQLGEHLDEVRVHDKSPYEIQWNNIPRDPGDDGMGMILKNWRMLQIKM